MLSGWESLTPLDGTLIHCGLALGRKWCSLTNIVRMESWEPGTANSGLADTPLLRTVRKSPDETTAPCSIESRPRGRHLLLEFRFHYTCTETKMSLLGCQWQSSPKMGLVFSVVSVRNRNSWAKYHPACLLLGLVVERALFYTNFYSKLTY